MGVLLALVLGGAVEGLVGAQSLAQDSSSSRPALEVDVFPGRSWENRAAPLSGDPLQVEPGSAVTFDGATIEDGEIDDVAAAVNATPGVSFTNLTGNGQNANITLRGAGNQTLLTTAEQPVGLYVDDVFLANPAAFNFDLFDAERIEVLRGPQGTRGGRNSIAGAIRIETVKPRPGTSVESELTLGTFELRRLRANANTALIEDRIFNRLAATYTDRDGTVENLAGGDEINTLQNWGLRNQTGFALTPDLDARLSLDFADYSPVQTAIGPFDTVVDQEVTLFDPFEDNRQLYGGALTLDWRGSGFDLTSITALRGLHYDAEGSDFGGANLLLQQIEDDQLQASQEFRFSGSAGPDLDWVAGSYFFAEDLERGGFQQFNALAPVAGLPAGHRETSLGEQFFLSGALFGEATWHLTEKLDLIAGARLTYDHKSLDYRHVANDGIGALAPLQSLSDEISTLDLSPRVGLAYHPSENLTLYGTVARGYKGGGFNTAQIAGSDASFDAETAINYEIGVKSTWFDDRLVANASAFWFDWNDQQVQSIEFLGFPTVNAEASRVRGADLSIAARPIPGVDFIFGAAYTDATFTDFTDFPARAGITDVTDRRIPLSSEVTVNAALQVRRPLDEEARWFGRVDYAYRSDLFFDAPNAVRQPGYHLVSAKAGIETDAMGFYFWGKNLLDSKYRLSAADNGINGLTSVAGEPRSFGIELKVRF